MEKDNHIFVLEGYDPKKDETFYRPIGGGIEFGELAKEAAVREFQEELGTNIIVDNDVQVFENIFEYNGKPGHEVVFILDANLVNSQLFMVLFCPRAFLKLEKVITEINSSL